MNDKRREILMGYLLEALEPEESAKVDAELQINEDLRNDLASLYREISPMNELVDHHEPPVGLAKRTCRNIWAKIDSSQTPHISNSVHSPHFSEKKRKITVVVSHNDQHQNDQHQEEITGFPHQSSVLETKQKSEDLNPDVTIPLSQALLLTTDKPRKPNEILRRVDHPATTPVEPHLFLEDSLIIAKRHPPKHYGNKSNAEPKVVRPWTTRDVVASLLIGLAAAVMLFPIVQMGINGVYSRIVRQKIQNVAKSVPPNTSQYSLGGITPNDVRVMTSVSIGSQSAVTTLQNRMSNADTPYHDSED